MDIDEYEYLEKAVEQKVNVKEKPEDDRRRSHHSRKGEDKSSGKREEEANGSDRRERRDRRERDPNGYMDKDRDRDRERRSSSRSKRHDREVEDDRDTDRGRRSSSRSRRHEREAVEDMDRVRERRSSSRSRRYRDAEEERDRDRGRRSSSRSRRHDIEAEEEMERKSMSKSRRHDRDELNGQRDGERERSRKSESRSRKYDREVEHEVERARSRDRIEREREFERELRENESRRSREKKEAEDPEAEPERDQRTVFAYQMPLKATERDVYEFFSQAGKDVRLIMDRISKRSKGVGYVEFYDVMSIQKAIQLSGQPLLGQPVMVKYSEAEKNLVSSTASGSGASGVGAERKLYVGNLHFLMNEEQLRKIFEAFGPVELVQLPLDMETGYCKGFGFVQFAQLEHAKAAQQSLNGTLEIAGRIIKVSSVTEHVGTQDAGSNATDFDDDDGGGLALNAHSRALLMQKLDRTGTTTSIVNGGVTAVPSVTASKVVTTTLPTGVRASAVEPIGQPSECILLKNMFDPKTETDPDFDLEIKDDVQDECSKFGTVRHIYVDKNSDGHVYLRFDSVAAAVNCQRAMHMRWFARRCISATFMMPREYETKVKGTQ